MSAPDPRMRWWGWGVDGHDPELSGSVEALLREELGAADEPTPPVALEDVRLPDSGLSGEVRKQLEAAVGGEHVRDDRLARVAHAAGRSYPDLVRLRAGDGSGAPDAVVYPGSREEVAAVLAACQAGDAAVIPFGGGTSVVGGVEALRDGFSTAVCLDLARMDELLHVDERSLLATLQGGVTGPEAEQLLGRHGLTLGHFPQSFEFATIGGFVATRSAGQASTGYGRIDELVQGLTLVAPAGEMRVRPLPASAAGPKLRELMVGSEGALGVICDATLAVRRVPAAKRYEGWSFRSFEEGLEGFRALEQDGAAPDVARLSDEEETRLSLAASATGSRSERLARSYLRLRGHDGGCIVIAGWEGDRERVSARRERTATLLRRSGAIALGGRPGQAWLRGRYAGPYLRDVLMGRGLLVETLETAGTWSGLKGLYEAVRRALRESLTAGGTPPFVICHVSHLYRTGASLYFTFLARARAGEEIEQWRAAKTAACDAIGSAGGTITHHHAIGHDHAPWMEAEVGEKGIELLRAAKATLDPAGIMNPGKLLPPALRQDSSHRQPT